LQNDVDSLNASVLDVEAGLLVGTIAALSVLAVCLFFSCWYFLVRKKNLAEQRELAECKSYRSTQSGKKAASYRSFVQGYQHGQEKPAAFQSIFNNYTQ
jgi:hypothetical protein